MFYGEDIIDWLLWFAVVQRVLAWDRLVIRIKAGSTAKRNGESSDGKSRYTKQKDCGRELHFCIYKPNMLQRLVDCEGEKIGNVKAAPAAKLATETLQISGLCLRDHPR